MKYILASALLLTAQAGLAHSNAGTAEETPTQASTQDSQSVNAVPKPAAIIADGIPAVPRELADHTRPYFEVRTASFSEWDPETKGMFIS
ncbi:MAG: hypothetical protein HRU31_18485, partial [Rhodobacteraceae bacterium]|nr:hypothetical protein [Paracoccaceae bacterium]